MPKYMLLHAGVTGEMAPSDIPVSPSVDVEKLKEGDDDPMEVVVEVPASKSKRGWHYTEKALQDIVDHVNEHTLNADLGHQKPEDVSNEFRPPVTHWIGAKMVGKNAYFRGVVDAAAKDLKRWIRAGRIKQVSIFGQASKQQSMGETHVVGYKPLSIDWTPLDRMGMDTRIVAVGEMESFDDEAKEEEETLTKEELLKAMKDMIEAEELTIKEVLDALGIELDESTDGEMEVLQEVFGEMESFDEVLKEAKQALEEKAERQVQEVIGEMADEKIADETVRKDLTNEKTPIGKMWALHANNIGKDSTKKEIAGEMDAFLADEAVKSLIATRQSSGGGVITPNNNKGARVMSRRKRVNL